VKSTLTASLNTTDNGKAFKDNNAQQVKSLLQVLPMILATHPIENSSLRPKWFRWLTGRAENPLPQDTLASAILDVVQNTAFLLKVGFEAEIPWEARGRYRIQLANAVKAVRVSVNHLWGCGGGEKEHKSVTPARPGTLHNLGMVLFCNFVWC
jgi:hypothetical protein